MFVGTMDMDNIFSADGHSYQVQIPEPSAYGALFALAAAGAALYRRRQGLRQL